MTNGDNEHSIKVDMRECMESYPCCHMVEQYGKLKNMDAREIVREFQSVGMPIPEHFQYVLTDGCVIDMGPYDETLAGKY